MAAPEPDPIEAAEAERRQAQSRMARQTMKSVLIFAAVGEAATGLALLIVPSLVGQLLLGEQLTGVAIPVARVAGIALIALGDRLLAGPAARRHVDLQRDGHAVSRLPRFRGWFDRRLLWPAVVLHVILTALLTRDVTRMRRDLRK